jgi:Icc-related predicted phosphoesterase
MKLLLFSDLHANRSAAEAVVRMAQDADIVVGAGDFANGRRDIEVCIDVLKTIDRPAILVAGNNESTEELRIACRVWPSAIVLHGSAAVVNGIAFYGLGGGVPVTPFGAWSYDFSEDEAAELLAGCPSGCVLVTHSPPRGTVDLSSQGKSLGSAAVRDAIVRTAPRLVVCGHIHASGGKQGVVGETPVVNAGPAGMIWDIA